MFIKPRVNTPVSVLDIPLGILSLSAYIKKYSSFPVQTHCLDLRLTQNSKILTQKIDTIQPHLIGISLMDCESNFLNDYQTVLEKYHKTISLVAGGPYATGHYETIIRTTCISLVIVGEGERSFLGLVQRLVCGQSLNDLQGLAWRSKEGTAIFNGKAPYIENLDDIPIPDYDLIPLDKYQGYHPNMNGVLAEHRYIPVMSSRACPFRCIFCHNMFGKKVRPRSVDHFIKEIKLLRYQYNIREFHIIDDYFNFDRKRMHAILDQIIQDNVTIRIAFPNALRGDQLCYEDILRLKQAGTYMINFAVETGSKRLQKKTGKHLNLDVILQNIAIAKKMGIITRGYFMLGFPSETRSELQETIDLACNSDLSMVSFFTVIPFKGTPLYEWSCSAYPQMKASQEADFWSSGELYSSATGLSLKRIKKLATIRFYSFQRLVRLMKNAPRKIYFFARFAHSAISILRS